MTAYDAVGPGDPRRCGRTSSVGVLPLPQAENPIPGGRICCRPRTTRRGSSRACRSARAATPAPTAPMRWRSGAADNRRAVSIAPCSARNVRGESAAARISELLSTAGLVCTFLRRSGRGKAVYSDRGGRICADLGQAPRRASARNWVSALERLLPLGGYAVPLSPPALASKAEPMTHERSGAAPGHSRHHPLCRRRSEDCRGRAADPARLERERPRAEPQGDRGLPRSRRRNPSLSRRERSGAARGARAAPRARSRRASFAAPAPTS